MRYVGRARQVLLDFNTILRYDMEGFHKACAETSEPYAGGFRIGLLDISEPVFKV